MLAVKNKLLLYDYCFAWGSKAVKYKNEKTGNLEGIHSDLVVLDNNFRLNGIESIITYDKFSGIPYIKCSNYGNSNSTPQVTPKNTIDHTFSYFFIIKKLGVIK